MSERKPSEHHLGKVIVNLIGQDLSYAEISRRLGISRYRIGRIAAAQGLPDGRLYAARRRAGHILSE